MGANKRPFFRIVVADSRATRDGRAVEELGFYDPRATPERFRIDRERLAYWLKVGAQPSATVRALLARHREEPAAADPEAAR
jgi:small subunit ribosomal protein S16